MTQNGTKEFIEIGPGKVLSGLVKRIDREAKVSAINNEEDINKLKLTLMNFEGKKILVTGATGGIGGAIVKKFLSLNASVLGTGTNLEKLNLLKNEFPSLLTEQFNISQHEKIDEFIDKVFSSLGGLDILVNNAGITKDNLSLRMKSEEWQKVIDINLTSTFYLCKSAIKKMLKNKFGRIVNITSIVGHTGNVG
ncbi:MAG: SDR family NAD(P)-dependent oxidoreductase, partial [Candidatus Pelagibacter sp.]